MYADDPDVSRTFTVLARTGDLSWASPIVQVEDTDLPDIQAEWLGSPGSERSLKVPLFGLPAGYMLFLRLVVPDDVDIELGYAILEARVPGTFPENPDPGNGGGGGGEVSYATLPPGTTLTLYYEDGVGWPARPTNRTDIVVVWTGGDENTPPTGAAVGVDKWDRPV